MADMWSGFMRFPGKLGRLGTATAQNLTINMFTNIADMYVQSSHYDQRNHGFFSLLLSNQALLSSPFYFSRGGYIDLGISSQRHLGNDSNYWSSSTSTIPSHAYYLHFNSTAIYPSFAFYRWYGFSV